MWAKYSSRLNVNSPSVNVAVAVLGWARWTAELGKWSVRLLMVDASSVLRPRCGLADVGPALDRVAPGQRLQQDRRRGARRGTGRRRRRAAASCARAAPGPRPSCLPFGVAGQRRSSPACRPGRLAGSSSFSSRTSTSPSMTSANSSCAAARQPEVPSARMASITYSMFLPTATFS